MDRLDALAVFARAVELGSLTAVARERRTTQPTISKVVAGLEQEVGARLFHRSTRRIAPTEEGLRLYEGSRHLLEQYAETLRATHGLVDAPSGLLRVNAPLALGHLRLNKLVLEFMRIHPAISVELIFNDRFVDMVEEGFDVMIRLGGSPPVNTIASTVASSQRVIVAAPSYLSQHPAIRRPTDLARHEFVQFAWASKPNIVELQGPKGCEITVSIGGRYRVNSSLATREALVDGAGVAAAPRWLVQDLLDTCQLLRVLPGWELTPHVLHVLHVSRRYRPSRVKLLLDFLRNRLPILPGFVPLERP